MYYAVTQPAKWFGGLFEPGEDAATSSMSKPPKPPAMPCRRFLIFGRPAPWRCAVHRPAHQAAKPNGSPGGRPSMIASNLASGPLWLRQLEDRAAKTPPQRRGRVGRSRGGSADRRHEAAG